MTLNRIPVWAAVLMLSSATLAYGQATVPAPGGALPPVATPAPAPSPAPGPTPQATGHDAEVPAPGGNVPPVATPKPDPTPGPGPSPQGGTTPH